MRDRLRPCVLLLLTTGFDDLVVAIEKTGYYPQVVAAGVRSAVAGENVVSFLVHHEPTIDRDEVRRHITVVVLTDTRLILCHTDEHAPDDLLPEPYTSTSTEAISPAVGALGRGQPDGGQPGDLRRRRRAHAERGGAHRRLGRDQPDRPRARRVLRPRVRRRPRLHRAWWSPTTSRCGSARRPTARAPSTTSWSSPRASPRAARTDGGRRPPRLRRAGVLLGRHARPHAGRRPAGGRQLLSGSRPGSTTPAWCCRPLRRTS